MPKARSPLGTHSRLELTDCGIARVSAGFLLRGGAPRDLNPHIARLAAQFITQNRAALSALRVDAGPHYDGTATTLELRASTTIGAVPLTAPTSGSIEYGLVVRPRFDWAGIGRAGGHGPAGDTDHLTAPAMARGFRAAPRRAGGRPRWRVQGEQPRAGAGARSDISSQPLPASARYPLRRATLYTR